MCILYYGHKEAVVFSNVLWHETFCHAYSQINLRINFTVVTWDNGSLKIGLE